MSKLERIGVIVLDNDTEMTNANFETAAWWEKLLIPAGEYEIMAEFEDYNKNKVKNAYVTYEGTVIADYFGALFFGNPVGTYDNYKNKGNHSSYSTFMYGFMLGESVEQDPEHYKLDEGFTTVKESWISKFDGKEHTLISVVRKE